MCIAPLPVSAPTCVVGCIAHLPVSAPACVVCIVSAYEAIDFLQLRTSVLGDPPERGRITSVSLCLCRNRSLSTYMNAWTGSDFTMCVVGPADTCGKSVNRSRASSNLPSMPLSPLQLYQASHTPSSQLVPGLTLHTDPCYRLAMPLGVMVTGFYSGTRSPRQTQLILTTSSPSTW